MHKLRDRPRNTPPIKKMSKGNSFQQGLGMALRVGVELTVAKVLGAHMGFALDK